MGRARAGLSGPVVAGLTHPGDCASVRDTVAPPTRIPKMNRYFWLLMRFIGDEHTREERTEIYERARNAFLEQLFSADPPFPDSKIAYERLAFEEAVRTVESSVARWGVPAKARESSVTADR